MAYSGASTAGTRINFVEEGDRIIFQPVTKEYINSFAQSIQAQARSEIRGAEGVHPTTLRAARKTANLCQTPACCLFVSLEQMRDLFHKASRP